MEPDTRTDPAERDPAVDATAAAADLAYLRQFLGLADAEVAHIFGTDSAGVDRWLRGDMPAGVPERIHAVADAARRIVPRHDLSAALRAPQPELGGRTGIELLRDGRADELVRRLSGTG